MSRQEEQLYIFDPLALHDIFIKYQHIYEASEHSLVLVNYLNIILLARNDRTNDLHLVRAAIFLGQVCCLR